MRLLLSLRAQVCPGEWVYHYVNTSALEGGAASGGHYGPGHHLRFNIVKPAGADSAVAVTRHSAAPLKLVPPYVSLGASTTNLSTSIDMCNVESGQMFLGLLGDSESTGCMQYDVTVEEFTGPCIELLHQPDLDPAAIADQTLPIEHFERASCEPYQWYDFYFPVSPGQVAVEDNFVFETEIISDQYELGALSVHLFDGTIPLDRVTQLVSDTPDGGIYSIAIPSIELHAGAYYLSVRCGPNPQRFRVVAFEIRGRLTGPGDYVHGEICPGEYIYHSIHPTFAPPAPPALSGGGNASHSSNATHGTNSSTPSSGRRRLAIDRMRRRLGAAGPATAVEVGGNMMFTFTKHQGDFIFMSLIGDHPPTRKQPPSRTLHYNEVNDFGIFCNLQPGNLYWITLLGGEHCAAYDLAVTELPRDDPRCATGVYDLVPNEAETFGIHTLQKEVPTYGSCSPKEYVDYALPLTFAADSDSNVRFQVELRGGGQRPDAISLLIYNEGVIPTDRATEIYSDYAVDGIYSLTVNVIDLQFQLCHATNNAHASCGHGAHGGGHGSNSTTMAMAVDPLTGNMTSVYGNETHGRRLAAAAPSGGNTSLPDLTYYVSIRCSDTTTASYKMLATAITSHLVNEISVHGELCPGGMIYHHWEHMAIGERRSVRFDITKHGGDGTVLVRHGRSFAEAPLKTTPPYLPLNHHDHHGTIMYCNASDAANSSDHVYVMFAGGEHCMSYEITAHEIPNDQCTMIGHGGSHDTTAAYATPITPHHFMYGSCTGNDWVDFSLTLLPSDYHYNYLIEVEDLDATSAGMSNAEALALYQFDDQIPPDRKSEHKSTRAVDGIYSVAINLHNFHAGMSFFSVQCNDVGDQTRRFRAVLNQIEQILDIGHEYHGEVCPGDWVYHSYLVPTNTTNRSNFQFHLVKHTGDVDIVVRHNLIPLKLVPPFTHVDAADYEADTQVCHTEPGETVYLGLLAGHHCASYEISVSIIPEGLPCAEPPHAARGANSTTAAQLVVDHFKLGSCAPNGWFDMYVDVTEHAMHDNLLFELEDLGDTGTLDAVSIYLWADSIPLSRKSEYFVTRSYGGTYSLSVSMHEFEPFLYHSHGDSLRIFFGVQCGAAAVEFRSFVHFVHSELTPGHLSHGEVCPGAWVYHRLLLTNALINGGGGHGGGGHRRLDSAVAINEAAARRQLGAAPAAGAADGVHVRFRITKNIGNMNLVLSLGDKPLRLVPPYTFLDANDAHVDEIICNIEQFLSPANTSERDLYRYYIGVKGGSVCAHYEIAMETFTGSCATAMANRLVPGDHASETHGSPGARECPQDATDCIVSLRHFMRGSCQAHERAPPFVIQIPYSAGRPLDNLVVEIEDLNPQDHPSSLSISLFPIGGHRPGAAYSYTTHEELLSTSPLSTTNSARQRIFSIGLSSIQIATQICGGMCYMNGMANFSLVVSCAAVPVRFSVITMNTNLALQLDVPTHGEVCPGDWVYHSLHVSGAPSDATGVSFDVHVHKGDIYYLLSRWTKPPGFAACNSNEFAMTGLTHGHVDLCDMRASLQGVESSDMNGFVGLFGGRSCSLYSITASYKRAGQPCSNATTGSCSPGHNASAAAGFDNVED